MEAWPCSRQAGLKSGLFRQDHLYCDLDKAWIPSHLVLSSDQELSKARNFLLLRTHRLISVVLSMPNLYIRDLVSSLGEPLVPFPWLIP